MSLCPTCTSKVRDVRRQLLLDATTLEGRDAERARELAAALHVLTGDDRLPDIGGLGLPETVSVDTGPAPAGE